MKRPHAPFSTAWIALVLTGALIAPASGQDTAPSPAVPAAPNAAAPRAEPETTPARPASAPAKATRTGPRTLDAVPIEGEVAVPRVLFVTARAREHYRDGLHWRFVHAPARTAGTSIRLVSIVTPF